MDFKSEVRLLAIGALISFVSAFVTNCSSERREDRKGNIQKKLELNSDLSKNLGRRLHFTYEMYKHKRKNVDSLYQQAKTQYNISREEWNLQLYSYLALIEFYYGQKAQNDFTTKVYNPMVELGQNAASEDQVLDKDFVKKYMSLRSEMKAFVIDAYRDAYD